MWTKLYGHILNSSVWELDSEARVVWITLLALADRNGNVRATPQGLARLAKVSQAGCDAALACFLAPEPETASEGDDGHRLEIVPHGWFIVKYGEYNAMRNAEERREQLRRASEKYRHQKTSRHPISPIATDTSTEGSFAVEGVQGEIEPPARKPGRPPLIGTAEMDPEFLAAFEQYPKRAGSNSRTDAYRCWKTRIASGVLPADLMAGLVRYTAFCHATGKVNTEYVLQAATFFGPSDRWKESWEAPAPVPQKLGRIEQGRVNTAKWLAEEEAKEAAGAAPASLAEWTEDASEAPSIDDGSEIFPGGF